MKKNTLILFCILIKLSLSAQPQNFDISNYKLPDLKRQQLDFSFDLNGNSTSRFEISESGSDTLDRNEHNYNFYGTLKYSLYKNSVKVQKTFGIVLESESRINKNLEMGRKTDSYNYFSNNLILNYNYKYFLKEDGLFVMVSPGTSFLVLKNRDFINESNTESGFFNSYSLMLGFGTGRIERVEDFRHAVLIIQELQKRGVFEHNPTNEEIYEFAQLISDLKNRRFFDSRKRKEQDLIEIDQFFVDEEILTENDISYFVGLEDMWAYGGLQERLSGNQFKISFMPSYSFERQKMSFGGYELKNEIQQIYNEISYYSCKPLNLKFQQNYRISVINRISDNYIVFTGSKNKNYYSGFLGYYILGFYPNTRTYINLTGRLDVGYASQAKIFSGGYYSEMFSLSSEGYYYFSEKLRLGYRWAYRNSTWNIFDNNVTNDYYRNSSVELTLNYAIF